MPVIGREDLERLLASQDHNAVLVLIGGKAAVVPEESLRSGEHAGALLITSREDLIAEFDVGMNEEQLDRLAQRLDVAIGNLGA